MWNMNGEDLNTRIFLTDAEFEELFGPKISRIVALMNEAAQDVCPPCNGYCCKNIKCVLYSEKFSTCPIYEIRPRECRYHFCHQVFQHASLTDEEKDMMQQPIEELICGNRGEIARLFFLFPDFPLDRESPFGRWAQPHIETIINDYTSGLIQEPTAFERIMSLCLSYKAGSA